MAQHSYMNSFSVKSINGWMYGWIKSKERDWTCPMTQETKRINECKLQEGRFQLDWVVFDKGNEPLVTVGIKIKPKQAFS